MDINTFENIERFMSESMRDSAHDREHVYRVLYNALDIAKTTDGADLDILVCACLLHDIGRKEQFADPSLDHAEVGGEKAYSFLIGHGFDKEFAEKVKACIVTHRFRKSRPPESIEAKILFDADKLDVTGATGIARTLVYKGGMGEPLYMLDADGLPSSGENDCGPSFFGEYNFKLKNLYGKFYTERGRQLAAERENAARGFYESLLGEVRSAYVRGMTELDKFLNGG